MMYMIDWITCCCYMMLRKFHYADWDAKYTAILNSSVVCGVLFIAVVDMILLIVSPERLQYLYDYPRTRYLLSDFIILFLLFIRYYYLRKDAIPLMKKRFKEKGPHKQRSCSCLEDDGKQQIYKMIHNLYHNSFVLNILLSKQLAERLVYNSVPH